MSDAFEGHGLRMWTDAPSLRRSETVVGRGGVCEASWSGEDAPAGGERADVLGDVLGVVLDPAQQR
jgi:hypothetical protein